MNKKWQIYETDKEKVEEIEKKYQINKLLSTILVNRNIIKEEDIRLFLNPTREDFYDLEQELLDYDFCLIDNSRNQLYYMKVKEPNNFIRKAFDSTIKNEIYFGKEILQNKITEDDLIKKIKTIGK